LGLDENVLDKTLRAAVALLQFRSWESDAAANGWFGILLVLLAVLDGEFVLVFLLGFGKERPLDVKIGFSDAAAARKNRDLFLIGLMKGLTNSMELVWS